MATELVLSTQADPPVGPDAPLLDVMATMRAMVQRAYGPPDVLSLRTIARPTLGAQLFRAVVMLLPSKSCTS